MFIVKDQQLSQMAAVKDAEQIEQVKEVLKNEHPHHYANRPEDQWQPFIKLRCEEAGKWGIDTAPNQYLYLLATLEYPQYFTGEVPEWMVEELEWPDRNEEDKIVILYKEILKRTDLPKN